MPSSALAALLDVAGLVEHQHPVRRAQRLDHIAPQVLAHPALVPHRPVEQPLHPVRRALPRPAPPSTRCASLQRPATATPSHTPTPAPAAPAGRTATREAPRVHPAAPPTAPPTPNPPRPAHPAHPARRAHRPPPHPSRPGNDHNHQPVTRTRSTQCAAVVPVRAPRANAIAERFVGTIRRELLDRIPIINRRHAGTALREYEHHYNRHRPHRTLGHAAPYDRFPAARQARQTTSGGVTGAADSSVSISRPREVRRVSGTRRSDERPSLLGELQPLVVTHEAVDDSHVDVLRNPLHG